MKRKQSPTRLIKTVLIFGAAVIMLIAVSCKKDKPTKASTPPEPVTDIDNNTYKTVKIGTQVWMAENLKTTKYQNGEAIENKATAAKWMEATAGYCDPKPFLPEYGKLYNGYAVTDPRNIAPKGWRVPTNDDFVTLIEYLTTNANNDIKVVSNQLRETGTKHWNPNDGASNTTGFTAFPSPIRYPNDFFELANKTVFLSSSSNQGDLVALFINPNIASYTLFSKTQGLAIRCIRE
ncbi:MAG: fibrobacter succinogenes major paralogous domain-containing protein [Daejeonella sp.]